MGCTSPQGPMGSVLRMVVPGLLLMLLEALRAEAHVIRVPLTSRRLVRSEDKAVGELWSAPAMRLRGSPLAGGDDKEANGTSTSIAPRSEPLDTMGESHFVGEVLIGTPPQKFQVLFDTGSATMWVPSTQCNYSCMGKDVFNSSDSRTFVKNGAALNLSYWSGGVLGFYSNDDVSIAGLTIRNQTFGELIDIQGPLSLAFESMKLDGVVGMAFDSLSNGVATPLHNLMAQGLVSRGVFSFYLGDDGAGELTIGGSDTRFYQESSLFFTPVLQPATFWTIALQNVTVSGQSLSSADRAMLDSGTPWMRAPRKDVESVAHAVGAAPANLPGRRSLYSIEHCNLTALPTLVVHIDGKELPIQGSDYAFYQSEGSTTCILALTAHQRNDTWVLGNAFMNTYYTVFDFEHQKVGFAKAIQRPRNSTSPSSPAN